MALDLDVFSLGGGGGGGGLQDVLMKIAVFVLVQALVYLILSKSSNIFSTTKSMRSLSFRPARSVSIRRMLAVLSDVPQENSPRPNMSMPSRTYSSLDDEHKD
ncbi:hypothetical protein J5N97_006808 [Dioscorea zingiberensis]|uniref:Uncharacterized protein n=1 Tax=Dioscorea zingiberensis TaxID=325984 RepID=A0A9D5DD95_9LILI|nr:hypothetical protein J5N97_006808 [Dioscorea zingiberensis]